MMRKGYKLILSQPGVQQRVEVDRSVADFVETMGYGRAAYADRDAFLSRYASPWIVELRQAIKSTLQKERTVLSVGAGECEFEIPLFQEGYRIVASDVVPEALAPVRALFPEFRATVLDIFNPDVSERFDDVLIPGLDFYFPEEQLRSILRNVRSLLRPGGRLLFVLRYRDNGWTRLIDYIGIPLEYAARNLREWLRRSRRRYRFKLHGYRRTPREIAVLAGEAGFHLSGVRHAGFAMELTRLHLHRLPWLFAWLHRLDSRLHWFNNAILMEFTT